VLRLLGERIAIRAIARVTGLSRSWLQRFVNGLYRERTPHEPGPLPKESGDLVIEADEMWSFVGKKLVQVWVWAALDADTRAVVAMVTGDRSGGRPARCSPRCRRRTGATRSS
jgi:insertion element IS1 protein InsB